jgi:hypothetical protein
MAALKGSGAPAEEEKKDETPHVNMTRLKFLSYDLERVVRIEQRRVYKKAEAAEIERIRLKKEREEQEAIKKAEEERLAKEKEEQEAKLREEQEKKEKERKEKEQKALEK